MALAFDQVLPFVLALLPFVLAPPSELDLEVRP